MSQDHDHQDEPLVLQKKKLKPIMNFSLKEDSSNNDSSSEDEETNNLLENLDDSDEDITVFDD